MVISMRLLGHIPSKRVEMSWTKPFRDPQYTSSKVFLSGHDLSISVITDQDFRLIYMRGVLEAVPFYGLSS